MRIKRVVMGGALLVVALPIVLVLIATVVLNSINGGGHSWPNGGWLPAWLVGPTSHDIDATSVMWTFFRKHRLSAL